MVIAVCVSGSGRTLENFLRLGFPVKVVVSSRDGIRGNDIAKANNVPLVITKDVFDAVGDVDLVCLAGWLHKLVVPPEFANRVMNIHPSLLPSFGGKGFYGHHVHEAVLAHGCKLSGCTVHFVDNEYDTGPIICQRAVPVLAGDRPADLAARVFEAECLAYPEAVRSFAAGLSVVGRNVLASSPGPTSKSRTPG